MSEPTAVPERPAGGDGSSILSAMSDTERAHWQMSGELPKADPVAAPVAEPDDEPEPEPEPAPGAKPAAVSATPEKPVSKRQQQINDLIRARTEAEQRATALETRLAAMEARKPEPAKSEPVAVAPISDPADPEPTEDEIGPKDTGAKFQTYAEFSKALAKWVFRQDKREADAVATREAASTREREAQTAAQQRLDTWKERRDAFAATEPDFVAKAGPFLDRVTKDTPLCDVLMDSPIGPAIAWHLSTHSEDSSRIAQLEPFQQLRALWKLEDDLSATLSPRTSASAGPAAKHVTTAPAPPVTISARSADVADPLDAALKERDFRRYEAEANARDLAGAKR